MTSMAHISAVSQSNDSGRIPLILRLSGIVERSVAPPHRALLEYAQLQAAIASRRPVAAASALERLVGRCWDDLSLAARAQLLGLAVILRGGLQAEA